MLISGSEEGVDVDDLMKHINYAGSWRWRRGGVFVGAAHALERMESVGVGVDRV
jgi:hypothetical protein